MCTGNSVFRLRWWREQPSSPALGSRAPDTAHLSDPEPRSRALASPEEGCSGTLPPRARVRVSGVVWCRR